MYSLLLFEAFLWSFRALQFWKNFGHKYIIYTYVYISLDMDIISDRCYDIHDHGPCDPGIRYIGADHPAMSLVMEEVKESV